MTGSISEPSIAVVAIVEPEIAEKIVPATIATTASRPGTWLISLSTPSMTFSARPVWNSTSPIKTNSGIGVSEKLIAAATLLRATCCSPASPPRNRIAPITLIAMNEIATGIPTNSRSVEPPRSSSAAICQDMLTRRSSGAIPGSSRGNSVVAQADLGHGKPVHAEDEFDAEQDKADRQWRKCPPFRRDQCLDNDRAGRIARH